MYTDSNQIVSFKNVIVVEDSDEEQITLVDNNM